MASIAHTRCAFSIGFSPGIPKTKGHPIVMPLRYVKYLSRVEILSSCLGHQFGVGDYGNLETLQGFRDSFGWRNGLMFVTKCCWMFLVYFSFVFVPLFFLGWPK